MPGLVNPIHKQLFVFLIMFHLTIYSGCSIAYLCAHSPFIPPEFKVCTSHWWDFPHLETSTQTPAYGLPLGQPTDNWNPSLWDFPYSGPYSNVGFLPLRVLPNFPLRCWDFPHSEAKSLQVPLMGLPSLENNTASLANRSHAKSNISQLKTNNPRRRNRFWKGNGKSKPGKI